RAPPGGPKRHPAPGGASRASPGHGTGATSRPARGPGRGGKLLPARPGPSLPAVCPVGARGGRGAPRRPGQLPAALLIPVEDVWGGLQSVKNRLQTRHGSPSTPAPRRPSFSMWPMIACFFTRPLYGCSLADTALLAEKRNSCTHGSLLAKASRAARATGGL